MSGRDVSICRYESYSHVIPIPGQVELTVARFATEICRLMLLIMCSRFWAQRFCVERCSMQDVSFVSFGVNAVAIFAR